MRIFVTGATGFIGSRLVPELIGAGHTVLGLTRSEAGAEQLRAAGAEVQHGDILDLESLREGAAKSEGVVHLAFQHDFSQFLKVCEDDRKAIEAMGEVLVGSKRPFVVTSGTAIAANVDGKPSTEESREDFAQSACGCRRRRCEALAARGVNTSVVRLAQIHDTHKQGLVPYVTAVAREKGVSVYIGEGANRWPAAHVTDTARLYRLAIEKAEPGAIYHAVDEEGVTVKAIAEAIGRGLKVPVKSITPDEVEGHFGWLAMFAGLDMPSSSAITRKKLGWTTSGPGLIADLDGMDYSEV